MKHTENYHEMAGFWAGQRDRLALLIASGKTIVGAAKEAGMTDRTAYRYLKDPMFRARIAELRAEMLDRAIGKLADSCCKAVDTLTVLLEDGAATIRLRAAIGILESLGRLRDHVEVERRLVALEVTSAKRLAQEDARSGGDGSGSGGSDGITSLQLIDRTADTTGMG